MLLIHKDGTLVKKVIANFLQRGIMQVTNGRARSNASIRYNSLTSLRFPTVALGSSQPSTTVQSRIPLGLNFKIMSVSYVLSGVTTGASLALNVTLGTGSYETAGAAPTDYFTIGGTYANGDTITVTLGGVSYTYTVNAEIAGNNAAIVQHFASAINRNQPFASTVFASAQGLSVVISLVAYSTATSTFTVSKNSTSGTVTANAANLSGGATGVLPAQPVIDNPLQTAPFNIAASGTALFPIDTPILLTNDQPGVLYTKLNNNFDAIWPSFSELTLRTITGTSMTGNLDVILWGVPYDVNPFAPQDRVSSFLPGPRTI